MKCRDKILLQSSTSFTSVAEDYVRESLAQATRLLDLFVYGDLPKVFKGALHDC